jgi:hypothetical protein
VWANMSEYEIEGHDIVWGKIRLLSETFQKYPDARWLWWLDYDALIMTPSIALGRHLLDHDVMNTKIWRGRQVYIPFLKRGGGLVHNIPENITAEDVNMIIAMDRNGINAGSLFLRKGWWSELLLDLWLEPLYITRGWYGMEQDALVHILTYHGKSFNICNVGIVDQKEIDSYPQNAVSGQWTPDDLVLHLAGCK